jgi:hypothetical protein
MGSPNVKVPISIQVGTAFPLMLKLSCSHTSTFHYKLQGATNVHYDEVLTVPGHLLVQKLVLYYPQPLTDFCTYPLTTVAVCDSESARTSVTTALMSVAIASILKVFFMTKKERKVYNVKQKGMRREQRKREKRIKGRVNSGKKRKHWNVLGWCVRSYMYVRRQYTILFRSAVSISRECIRKNFACERQFAVARDQRDYVKNHDCPGIIAC